MANIMRIGKKLIEKVGNDIIKDVGKYALDKLLKSRMSEKKIDSEILKIASETRKRLGNLKRSRFKELEYLKDVTDWLNYEPKDVLEKKAKLSVLANFVGDDRVSTTKGLKKEIGDMYDAIKKDVVNNKLGNSAVGYSFYKTFIRETGGGNMNTRLQAYASSEEIVQAILDWRLGKAEK